MNVIVALLPGCSVVFYSRLFSSRRIPVDGGSVKSRDDLASFPTSCTPAN